MGGHQGCFVALLLIAVGLSAAQQGPKQRHLGLSRGQPLGSTQAFRRVGDAVPPKQTVESVPVSDVQLIRGSQLVKPVSISQLQDSKNVLSQQVLQGPVKKAVWHFPQAPQPTRQLAANFEMRQPTHAQSVAVECGENSVYVEVKKDLFGTGELIDPLGLTLGGACAAVGEDAATQVLMFVSQLQACNSALRLTENELVYTFTIIYAPNAPSTSAPVLRTSDAVIGLECHYPRFHNVSSNALLPAWIPYASTQVAADVLLFSLKLMTDDWKFERPSNQYFLGDFINIEASVMQYNHVPLRVHVDSCVATAVPDINAAPRYPFIDNSGCFLDAKITGSKSRFMPQAQADKLQFQLEAFKFQQDRTNLIYIACFLKATAASLPVDAGHKACSFSSNGWTAAFGNDRVCGCCDTSCSLSGRGASDQGLRLEGGVTLGPVEVKQFAL